MASTIDPIEDDESDSQIGDFAQLGLIVDSKPLEEKKVEIVEIKK